jgi:dTDP-glucose pyrophosphorylase
LLLQVVFDLILPVDCELLSVTHQILVLMAGSGSRVKSLGQKVPKPLVRIHGLPLISIVVQNLKSTNIPLDFVFVCQESDYYNFDLKEVFDNLEQNYKLVLLDSPTEGAAVSALKAYNVLDECKDLTIANSDQLFVHSFDSFLRFSRQSNSMGTVMSMVAQGSKWSYIRVNSLGLVEEVQEKLPISNLATVGVYYFRNPKIFHDAASGMISKNIKTNGEYYLAPCYNEIINSGSSINHYLVGTQGKEVFGLGTSEDINYFESLPYSKNYLVSKI